MSEERSRGEGLFEGLEGVFGGLGEGEWCVFLEESGEGRACSGEVRDEATVEVGETEEGLKLLDRRRLRPVEDGLDFSVVHLDTGGGDDEAEELAAVAVEFALFAFNEQPILAEAFEDLADVVVVFVGVRREDEDVVEVDDDEVVQEIAKDVVHESLEGGGSVGETEGHDKGFEVAVASAESGLPLVTFLDPDKVVSPAKVEFGEDLGTAEAVDGFSDEGKGGSVLDGDLVEASVVDTEPQTAVLLFDEEDRCAGG